LTLSAAQKAVMVLAGHHIAATATDLAGFGGTSDFLAGVDNRCETVETCTVFLERT
jgi:hypothetical protein